MTRALVAYSWLLTGVVVGLALPAAAASAREAASPAPAVSATENDLEDLKDLLNTNVEVWAATKSPTSVAEVPAVVTVVTRDDMARWGYRTLADVLAQTLGFYVVNDFILPNVSVRGIGSGLFAESGNIKVMIDGHSVAFRPTGGNWLGPELVPLAAIERIEIIRGPASALYGADAFLGVVNVITREAASIQGAALDGLATAVRKRTSPGGDGVIGTTGDNWSLLAAGDYTSADYSGAKLPASSPAPNVPMYNQGATTARNLDQQSQSAFGKLTYAAGDKLELTGWGSYSSIQRGADLSSWSQLAYGYDPQGRLNQNRVSLQQGLFGLDGVWTARSDFSLTLNVSGAVAGPASGDHIEVGSDLYSVHRSFGSKSVDANLEGRWNGYHNLALTVGTSFMFDHEDLLSRLDIAKQAVAGLSPGETIASNSDIQGSTDLVNVGAYAQA